MIGQIYINDNDRFQIDTQELTSGDDIEVLVWNGITDKAEWTQTTVEHNGEAYYLTGLLGYSPVGLFARKRRKRNINPATI